ncbi:hypothetical protein GCM10011332_11970 [Terasakiella brassicae]|uniref:Nucleoid-associated protein n=1 Tax=Terasakiella brassicae TaxID=1634917 RepID=A0A917BXF9_9PROT|nr:nucleoid-associated protein [Terasakiella brassicae]GGF59922.1 hypothetical protein GCM10011332_11970 [Terasakiella brassicae]
MIFENLTIRRLIIHEVFKRDHQKNTVQPIYGDQLIALGDDALAALRTRVIHTMGRASKNVEMEIGNTDPGGLFSLSKELMSLDDNEFILRSRNAANQLSSAQTRRDTPGGILVVFSGVVDYPEKNVIGFIKAEPHNGFTRVNQDDHLSLAFIEDLILTPQAKLYKIGVFLEMDPDLATNENPSNGYRAFIYDENMSPKNPDNAAQYFYEGFLGCAFPESSARLTREFHHLTKNFIYELDIPEEEKIGLHQSLYSYLKLDQGQTVHVGTYANTYLRDDAMRDAYEAFMRQKEFPQNAIAKDLTQVELHLQQRKISFRRGVKLTAPADRFANLIEIEQIDGVQGDGGEGEVPNWTRITVKDMIASQE